MERASADALRRQLVERQARLNGALASQGPEEYLVRLLEQVDSALSKLGTDDYGRCLVCNDRVDDGDLEKNPLLEYCLCRLSPQQQRALEHDLELARRIQAALLPDPDLATAGWAAHYRYEPAGIVSGDYCDIWVRPEEGETIYFAVGDVSGKGVAASLLMTHLQAAFRSLVGADVPLAELVERVNRQLLSAGIATHFATLVCGRLFRNGRVELVNAGHCPPLHVLGGDVEPVAATGYPVGLLADKPYEVRELKLEPGHSLLLYTDGLTEARNAGGEEYGQERLESLLRERADGASPRRLVQSVAEDLSRFTAGAARLDDLTILALSRGD